MRENLELGGVTLRGNARLYDGIERVLTLFPGLKPRLRQRAGSLSGGEKQMLALANALILSPRLLLLDEPSLGLAPPLVAEALGHIQEINRRSGATVLIIEPKVREVLKIAQRVYVLRNGQVSFSGSTDELLDDVRLQEVYCDTLRSNRVRAHLAPRRLPTFKPFVGGPFLPASSENPRKRI